MSENNKQSIDDGAIDEVGGGRGQNIAQVVCPFCGKWVLPELRGGKLFCPVCGSQLGGSLGGDGKR